MIKKIIKALKENQKVTDWLIDEVETISNQAFYVLQKLETIRKENTREYSVTVYHKHSSEKNDYVGSSTFKISHKLSKNELTKMIEEAVFASSFIMNKTYELIKGDKKRTWKGDDCGIPSDELIDKIANIFISESSSYAKFNSLEIFHTTTTNRLINSQGIDYKKTLNKVNVEAIPSYDGEKEKVELYQYYTYDKIDFDKIRNDAKDALKDVTMRVQAKKITERKKVDIILKDQEVIRFISSLISDYSYRDVYEQRTNKVIGDIIQKDAVLDLLTISKIPSSKADAFDRDGIILKPKTILDKGVLVSYYGNNQYAQYLNIEPTGVMRKLKVKKGKTSKEKMRKGPHLEIIALSGIQIDMYSHYIGGEVRLAVYFDGVNYYPLSGFSFSGDIEDSLKKLVLSKEVIDTHNYQGPKYIKLFDMEII
ncbi:MAG: metallopeptidase TldD-related protein [Bacilli bacterium]|nr:metallopeptidase TldD-related protein [Bacilli bacterium]